MCSHASALNRTAFRLQNLFFDKRDVLAFVLAFCGSATAKLAAATQITTAHSRRHMVSTRPCAPGDVDRTDVAAGSARATSLIDLAGSSSKRGPPSLEQTCVRRMPYLQIRVPFCGGVERHEIRRPAKQVVSGSVQRTRNLLKVRHSTNSTHDPRTHFTSASKARTAIAMAVRRPICSTRVISSRGFGFVERWHIGEFVPSSRVIVDRHAERPRLRRSPPQSFEVD